MGGKNTTQTTKPPSYISNAQKGVISQAQTAASTPYQAYTGQLVSPLTDTQNAAISGINGLQGIQNPYLQSAQNYLNQSSSISPSAIQGFESPYTQDVVNATQAQFNNQNAQTNNNIVGNAISSGAWGGDRAGVAQGIAAGQEASAQAPVIAGLENQGYQTALSAAQNQSQLEAQAGYGMAGLGNEAVSTGLAGLNAQLQAGGIQQQQGQNTLNTAYQQWLNQQQYQFQTTNYLSGIINGSAGTAGGSVTTPGPSLLSQILGGASSAAGAYQSLGGASGIGSLFGAGSAAGAAGGVGSDAAGAAALAALAKRGGRINGYAAGGTPLGEDENGLPYGVPVDATSGEPVSLASIVPPLQENIGHMSIRGPAMRGSPQPQIQGVAPRTAAPDVGSGPDGQNQSVSDNLATNPLLRFGLATLAGQSPNAGVNIGQGGLAMIQGLEQQRQGELAYKQQQTEDQFKQQSMDMTAQQLSAEANKWAQTLALETKKEAAAEEVQKADLAIKQKGLTIEQTRAANEGAGTWSYQATDPNGMPIYLNNKTGETLTGTVKVGPKPTANGQAVFGGGGSNGAAPPWSQQWGGPQ